MAGRQYCGAGLFFGSLLMFKYISESMQTCAGPELFETKQFQCPFLPTPTLDRCFLLCPPHVRLFLLHLSLFLGKRKSLNFWLVGNRWKKRLTVFHHAHTSLCPFLGSHLVYSGCFLYMLLQRH